MGGQLLTTRFRGEGTDRALFGEGGAGGGGGGADVFGVGERGGGSVEEVETVVEAVAGSVWPPQVLEEIQHCHRPQHYDALGREVDLGWRSPCKENYYKFCEQTFFNFNT